MKNVLLLLFTLLSFNGGAQIILRGYKCLYDEGQIPGKMAEMYLKTDTFRSLIYGNDIMTELDEKYRTKKERDDPKNILKAGLAVCFGSNYAKTKDSLYISTGQNYCNTFYYKVYIPEMMLSISVRSNKNDASFSDKSKWLLAQIRKNRKKKLYLVNEKNETCLDPFESDER